MSRIVGSYALQETRRNSFAISHKKTLENNSLELSVYSDGTRPILSSSYKVKYPDAELDDGLRKAYTKSLKGKFAQRLEGCFALLCFVLLCFALLRIGLLCFALLCTALHCFALL